MKDLGDLIFCFFKLVEGLFFEPRPVAYHVVGVLRIWVAESRAAS